MGTDKKVQVLMSTYNGEKYLRQQLDSILDQEFSGLIKILVRDDGSSDSTIDILEEYEKKNLIEVIYGTNIGLTSSILELLKKADILMDYYAFSDQDDIWFNDKTMRSVEFFKKREREYESDEIVLFFSSSLIVDENMNYMGQTFSGSQKICFYNSMIQNIMPGHTQMFNKALLNELKNIEPQHVFIIDWWTNLLATALGTVLYDDKPTVFHRQHMNNAVGFETNIIRSYVSRIRRIIRKDLYNVSYQLIGFRKKYGDLLRKDYICEVNNFIDNQKNLLLRIKFVLTTKCFRQKKIETFLFYLAYIMGFYRG